VRQVDCNASSLLFGRRVDFIIRHISAARFFVGTHLGDGSCQCGFAMINMTNRSNVYVLLFILTAIKSGHGEFASELIQFRAIEH